jgi:hypothetical protein
LHGLIFDASWNPPDLRVIDHRVEQRPISVAVHAENDFRAHSFQYACDRLRKGNLPHVILLMSLVSDNPSASGLQ